MVLLAQERFGPAFLYVSLSPGTIVTYILTGSLSKRVCSSYPTIDSHSRIHTDIQLQPADLYNYHPLLPSSSDSKSSSDPDPEAQAELSIEEKTCSICMEEVDTSAGPSSEVLLGMNRRRSYAVAPCHHLFHTKCLAQWLAIKVGVSHLLSSILVNVTEMRNIVRCKGGS